MPLQRATFVRLALGTRFWADINREFQVWAICASVNWSNEMIKKECVVLQRSTHLLSSVSRQVHQVSA